MVLVSLLSFDICRLILLVAVFCGCWLFFCYSVCCALFVVACLLIVVRCWLRLLSVGCVLCVVVYGFVLRVACWLVLLLVVSVCRLLFMVCCALFCADVVCLLSEYVVVRRVWFAV